MTASTPHLDGAERGRRLLDKVVLVTGAATSGPGFGNGAAAAHLYARQGARLVVVNRTLEHARTLEVAIQGEGGEALAVAADLTEEADAERAVRAAVERFGAVHILHNNVGMAGGRSVVDDAYPTWQEVLASNLATVLHACKHAIPRMREQGGGAIVNVSSIAVGGDFGLLPYAAAKGAVEAATRTMAVQHASDRIRVNCVRIGTVQTPRVARPGGAKERWRRLPPLGEGTAWDAAWAALFLASDEARWITGQVLTVDGGLTLTTRVGPAERS